MYPDFAFCHPLFSEGMRIYSDAKICRFLQSITKDQTISFLDDWNRRRDHKQRIYISYDSSNKNSDAGDIDLIEYGKAKDDKGIPVFNVGLQLLATDISIDYDYISLENKLILSIGLDGNTS